MSTEAGFKFKKLKEPSTSECVDVVISALGLFFKLGGTEEFFTEVFDKKSQRWLDRTSKQ
jgi:hypothetical protein